jgi:CDP-glucose 4,6-dehydratase
MGIQRLLHNEALQDIRDPNAVEAFVKNSAPSVVFHLAAQALVRQSYLDPLATFSTNVTGTATVLQALRGQAGLLAVVVATSDKVYRNDDSGHPFTEADPLGGQDPYSASKAAAELVVASWRHTFGQQLPPMATARAGNVIGGGDFGADRLIPDLVRADQRGKPVRIRHADATRPFQHVLDVLSGYLLLAETVTGGRGPQALNFGPSMAELSVRELLALWENATSKPVAWVAGGEAGGSEHTRLALDSRAAAAELGWSAYLDTGQAIAQTAHWYQTWATGGDVVALSQGMVFARLHGK